jgi:signal transduction histidine kinase
MPIGDTIFGRTILLVLLTVVVLTTANIAIIVLRAPPVSAPLTAYEVSRLTEGRPIAKSIPGLRLSVSATRPADLPRSGADDLFARAVASYLVARPTDVLIARDMSPALGGVDLQDEMRREAALYLRDRQFNPTLFGSFTIAVRQPDGRWRVIGLPSRDPLASWRTRTALWFLASLLLVIPIAWLFSSRLSRPMRSFARAAEAIGRRRHTGPVAVQGPFEVRRAAAAINEMQDRLAAYLAERSSMVGAIAHDLRTPLARLRFHLASAPDEVSAKAEAEIAEMEHLIAATLDFIQNEGQLRAHEAVDLALLVESAVDDFADLGSDVSLQQADPATVYGDVTLLKRLFANLISNALAYGRRARVSLMAKGDHAIIEVSDEGPGLPEQDLERVFLPFYRTETTRNRTTGGAGLGLAIVKAIAESHGGSVRLFNRGGLVAEIVLPIRAGSAAATNIVTR